ncbi:MAG: gamma carbonic anhydrase family protein [Bdellovibrionales bacterium]|nr:gamma carbonic anhydrase family protein [Bdellovibrionales bacterium]
MPLYELKGEKPQLDKGCWLAPSAELIGDVVAGKNCSFWFNTTLRGDVMPIRIGDNTNIQDGSTLHGTHHRCGVTIGNNVTVGHNVILHGCQIGDECLIGMGSVVMDLAKIPSRSIVGAGSLVTENSEFEEGMLIMGRPAKVVRPLKSEELAFLKQSAQNYINYTKWYVDEIS